MDELGNRMDEFVGMRMAINTRWWMKGARGNHQNKQQGLPFTAVRLRGLQRKSISSNKQIRQNFTNQLFSFDMKVEYHQNMQVL